MARFTHVCFAAAVLLSLLAAPAVEAATARRNLAQAKPAASATAHSKGSKGKAGPPGPPGPNALTGAQAASLVSYDGNGGCTIADQNPLVGTATCSYIPGDNTANPPLPPTLLITLTCLNGRTVMQQGCTSGLGEPVSATSFSANQVFCGFNAFTDPPTAGVPIGVASASCMDVSMTIASSGAKFKSMIPNLAGVNTRAAYKAAVAKAIAGN